MSSAAWTPSAAGSRAVLIGADAFRARSLRALPGVRNNLADLRAALTHAEHGLLAGRAEHCAVLGLDAPATVRSIGRALTKASEEAEELLLVYYAGHGLVDEDGFLHLAVPGTDPGELAWSAIPLGLLKRQLARAPAQARVLVLDCCFAGRAINAMGPAEVLVRQQLTFTGTYTMASTGANKPAMAPAGHRNTAFTGALLRQLDAAEPRTLDEIFERVREELGQAGYPLPNRASTGFGQRLALTRGPVPAGAGPLPRRRRPGVLVGTAAAGVLALLALLASRTEAPQDEPRPSPATSESSAVLPPSSAALPPSTAALPPGVENVSVQLFGSGATADRRLTIGVQSALFSSDVGGNRTVVGGKQGEGRGDAAVQPGEVSPNGSAVGYTDFWTDTAAGGCRAQNVAIGQSAVLVTAAGWAKILVAGMHHGDGVPVVDFRIERGTGAAPQGDRPCT